MKKILLRILFLIVGITQLQTGQAAIRIVTNNSDAGAGSLRNTIATAAAGDTITFVFTGTIFLNNNILWDKSLTIVSRTPSAIAIDGNNSSGLFQIAGGFNIIRGLTFQNAWTNFGAAIDLPNNGVHDTTILENCFFRNCVATGQGGAISAVFPRSLIMRNCWVDSCYSAAHSGGVYARNNCELINCTFSNNKAFSYAGAVYLEGPDCRVTNCTFANNSAGSEGSALYFGGDNTTIKLVNNTFTGNVGNSVLYLFRLTINGGAFAELYNNLFSNPALSFGNGNMSMAQPSVTGGNIARDASLNPYFGMTDMGGTDSHMGITPVLGNNGGSLPTVALPCGSQAINHGLDAYGPPTDQRDVLRNMNDAGAFEYTTPDSSSLVTICSGESVTIAGHVYHASGTYRDTLEAGTPCQSYVTTKLIVNSVQDTAVVFSQGTFFATEAPNKFFRWVDCSSYAPIAGATVSAFTPSRSGSYSVVQTQNGCSVNSACFAVEMVVSGIADGITENTFNIWPNPTVGSIKVMFENKAGNATLRLVNAFGTLVMERNNISANQLDLDLSTYAPGVYIVEVNADNRKHQNRLVKN